MIRYYTAAEVAHIWRRPVGTVHRLASEQGWRRSGDRRRPTLYNADDVEDTMNGTEPQDAITDVHLLDDGSEVKISYPAVTTVTYELITDAPVNDTPERPA